MKSDNISLISYIKIDRIDAEGDPEAFAERWVRENTTKGGWVQLTDRILARRANQVGWIDLHGNEDTAAHFSVVSAEGVDCEGRLWRLRWTEAGPTIWRLQFSEQENAACSTPARARQRTFISTFPHLSRKNQDVIMIVREVWTRQSRPGLAVGDTKPWTPTFACFDGWSDDV